MPSCTSVRIQFTNDENTRLKIAEGLIRHADSLALVSDDDTPGIYMVQAQEIAITAEKIITDVFHGGVMLDIPEIIACAKAEGNTFTEQLALVMQATVDGFLN